MCKPTIKNFNRWLFDTTSSPGLYQRKFSQIDIDALEECFKLFLGKYSISEFENMKSFKKLKDDFTYVNSPIKIDTFDEYMESRRRLNSFREPITGYSCDDNFVCSSVNPKFKNYEFGI